MNLRFLSAVLLSVGLVACTASSQSTPTLPASPTSVPTAASAPTGAPQAVPTSVPVAKAVSSPAAVQAAPPASTSTGPTAGAVRFELTDGSEARYRIREQLARRNLPNDAVGATKDVKGAVVLDASGKVNSDLSKIEVDLNTLRSDQGLRDRTIANQMLEVRRFPKVTFVPMEMRGLPWPLPASGEASFEMVGEMTIREVTRPVTWQVTAQLAQTQASGQAKTSVPLAEFELTVPSVASVLSTEDTVRLEIDFKANRNAG